MMLAKAHSTPSHLQVALKLLMNYQHKSDHEQAYHVGSPMSWVLANDERQIVK
jgi:hypothetical protein